MKTKNNLYLVRPKLKHTKLKSNFYDFFVCAAPSQFLAKRLHPNGALQFYRGKWVGFFKISRHQTFLTLSKKEGLDSWCLPSQTKIKRLGKTTLSTGVIVAGFQEG